MDVALQKMNTLDLIITVHFLKKSMMYRKDGCCLAKNEHIRSDHYGTFL